MKKSQQLHIKTITQRARELCAEMEEYYGQDIYATEPHTIENDAYNLLQSFISICKEKSIEYNPKIHKKLTRDKVVSITDKGKELVGVYWKGTNGVEILFETTPEKADTIIDIFNNPKFDGNTHSINCTCPDCCAIS